MAYTDDIPRCKGIAQMLRDDNKVIQRDGYPERIPNR